MSYNIPAGVAGPRQRPSTVTTAGYLLFAAAALYLINVIIGLATANKSLKAAKDVLAQTSTRNVDSAVKIGVYAGIGLNVVVLVVFVLMAMFVLRGSNAWRITTFVIAGLAVLCSFCGLAGSGISGLSTSGNLTAAQKDELKNAVPTWARDGQLVVSLLIAIALIIAIILLARPAANEFFRKPAVPVGIYQEPGYPAYPAYPPVQPPQPGTPVDGSGAPPGA